VVQGLVKVPQVLVSDDQHKQVGGEPVEGLVEVQVKAEFKGDNRRWSTGLLNLFSRVRCVRLGSRGIALTTCLRVCTVFV
jgi:hypothetical protein